MRFPTSRSLVGEKSSFCRINMENDGKWIYSVCSNNINNDHPCQGISSRVRVTSGNMEEDELVGATGGFLALLSIPRKTFYRYA